MPPQFKKPLEYDPALAQQTLQKSYANSDAAIVAKKRSLLAELGLADEEYELEDEDEEEPLDEDEEPLLVNRAHNHINGQASLPSYGYRDLFGKEMESRRRQIIDVKGYDQYLVDLLERSQEQLQALRSEQGLQCPGNVEVIPALQHELKALHEELKQLRSQQPPSPDTIDVSRGASSDLVQQVTMLQRQLTSRDSKLREMESETARLKALLADKKGTSDIATRRSDTDGMVEELQQELAEVKAREAQYQQQLAKARSDLAAAEANARAQQAMLAAESQGDQVAALQRQLMALSEERNGQVADLEAELRQKQEMKSRMSLMKPDTDATTRVQLQRMQAQLDELHAMREGVLEELVAFQSEIFSDKTLTQMTRMVRDREISRVRTAQSDLRNKLSDMESRLRDARDEVQAVRQEAEQTSRIRELEAQGQIAHYREKWRVEFDKRRKLHNTVLELKGNIRVLCRVRPLVDKERGAGAEGAMPIKCVSEEMLRVAAMENKAEKDFEFDRVLAPDEGQDKLYDEVAALITSVLDGFNVAIMAYGQTGSGKTFTMEGPEGNPGVNLRALADLFKLAEERSAVFTTTFSASVLEIYNEQIYDLLVSGAQDGDKLDVKQGSDGMYVPGLKLEEVHNMGEVTAMISRGKSNRSTFATNMNEHSSRSHLVLSVYVNCVSKLNGTALRGKLHLIDLAGSERLSRTGAQGDRLKEAQAINKSLSALGDVIQALQQRNAHIPYRNSKLTRLLEDSLGGNSKCVMIVNVSPAAENVSETKCSLEFASRARKVELGRARANSSADNGGSGGLTGSTSFTPSPAPSGRTTPASGRATIAGESSISRVGSRETMTSQMRRSSGPSGMGR
ncbi:hypothetical protein PLESTM_000580500 [Pleodorina starrii]|nr:hypothetical protein PLESTM_000580500 [Pleodorina starrii]